MRKPKSDILHTFTQVQTGNTFIRTPQCERLIAGTGNKERIPSLNTFKGHL